MLSLFCILLLLLLFPFTQEEMFEKRIRELEGIGMGRGSLINIAYMLKQSISGQRSIKFIDH